MLDTILLGKTRAAILREMYLNAEQRISFNELVRRVESGAGAVSRELKTLIAAGLVVEQREGVHRFLTAGKRSPVFPELKAFISKASGAVSIIRQALQDLETSIEVALVFGSVAKGTETAGSDLDLFIIGSAGYSALSERMFSIEERLGRTVQVLYFDVDSAADHASLRKGSTHALLAGPKMFVFGTETRLEALLAKDKKSKGGENNKPAQSDKRIKTDASRGRA